MPGLQPPTASPALPKDVGEFDFFFFQFNFPFLELRLSRFSSTICQHLRTPRGVGNGCGHQAWTGSHLLLGGRGSLSPFRLLVFLGSGEHWGGQNLGKGKCMWRVRGQFGTGGGHRSMSPPSLFGPPQLLSQTLGSKMQDLQKGGPALCGGLEEGRGAFLSQPHPPSSPLSVSP